MSPVLGGAGGLGESWVAPGAPGDCYQCGPRPSGRACQEPRGNQPARGGGRSLASGTSPGGCSFSLVPRGRPGRADGDCLDPVPGKARSGWACASRGQEETGWRLPPGQEGAGVGPGRAGARGCVQDARELHVRSEQSRGGGWRLAGRGGRGPRGMATALLRRALAPGSCRRARPTVPRGPGFLL